MFLCDPVAPANNGLSCLAGLGKFSSSVAAKTSIHSLVLFETLSKAKGQSYKTGHAHIKYLILDTQWQIWGNTSLRYTHYTCMQYKPKKIFVNNVFLFNTHVQYKLQKFLAKPVFFCRFGVLIYRPRAVQRPENIFCHYRPSFQLLFHWYLTKTWFDKKSICQLLVDCLINLFTYYIAGWPACLQTS